MLWLPATFIFAFQVPGSASNPACTMAEFALLVPSHTSRARSTTRKLPFLRESSLATAAPTTPAPTTMASYCFIPFRPQFLSSRPRPSPGRKDSYS